MIIWGGWAGHEPESGAHIVASVLEDNGFTVRIENTTCAFADPALVDMSLVVPIYTKGTIAKDEIDSLSRAVQGKPEDPVMDGIESFA
jgi:type 1 glutamine amidotransferase